MTATPEQVPGPASSTAFEIGTDGLGSLVVGYDGSDPARDALAFAAGVARRGGAKLLVAYVPAVTGVAAAVVGGAAAMAQAAREQGELLAAEVSATCASVGVRAEFVVRPGDPSHELEELAEERRADLLVVGRSASRGHAVLGSVTVALVKRGRRPVTVVP